MDVVGHGCPEPRIQRHRIRQVIGSRPSLVERDRAGDRPDGFVSQHREQLLSSEPHTDSVTRVRQEPKFDTGIDCRVIRDQRDRAPREGFHDGCEDSDHVRSVRTPIARRCSSKT